MLPYHQDIETCRAERIGEGGVTGPALDAALEALAPALDDLRAARDEGTLPLLRVPARTDDLTSIRKTVARFRESCADVLVLGTGGSSLGGRALSVLGRDHVEPRLHFLENVDPDGFEAALSGLDLRRVGLLIVSKSGTTAETLAQAFALIPRLIEAVGAPGLGEVAAVITDPPGEGGAASPLRRLAAELGIPVLDHEPGIGGRFAALTNVGLLPAALAGIAPEAVRAGAAEALEAALDANAPEDSPPALGAALNIAIARERGLTQTVMMPYLDRLRPFAAWHRQLWAESLGKDGKGTTPLAAHGTVDQHSQLQLWLDGPADKLFTLVFGASRGIGPSIAPVYGVDAGLEWLVGRRLGDLLEAEQAATRDSLTARGRPVRVISVGGADAETVGALMMHFMLETILAAVLLGADPYDQPAVEHGKRLARDALAAMGRG